jgi:hypothetical protein
MQNLEIGSYRAFQSNGRSQNKIRASVISGSTTGGPFKKVRTDVNFDRSISPDMVAKKMARPRFDQAIFQNQDNISNIDS